MSLPRRSHALLAVLVLGIAIGNVQTARADLVNLGTGHNLSWDRGVQPAGSNTVTLTINRVVSGGPPLPSFFGWDLNVSAVLISGTGTLNIGPGPTNPSPNVFATPAGLPVINPPGGGTTVALSNQDAGSGVTLPIGSSNLVTINFTSSNASGVFELRANFSGSTWTDGDSFDDHAFDNLLSGTLSLGTITVTAPSAVPEPGSLALATISCVGFLAEGWRRRKKRELNSGAQT